MERKIYVYWGEHQAGLLEEHNGSYQYTYLPKYLQGDYPPISLILPKREEPYVSSVLFPCFSNMLPEGANRKTICRRLHIDEHDLMGILMTFAGKDTIGNVHFRKE